MLVCYAMLLHDQMLSAVLSMAMLMQYDDTGGKAGVVSKLHFALQMSLEYLQPQTGGCPQCCIAQSIVHHM